MYVHPIFSVYIHPTHHSAVASIALSCVVMGLSISLLLTEMSSTYTETSDNWQQPPNSNPNPNLTPRRGLYFADGDEYHTSEILAIVTSALNLLVAAAL